MLIKVSLQYLLVVQEFRVLTDEGSVDRRAYWTSPPSDLVWVVRHLTGHQQTGSACVLKETRKAFDSKERTGRVSSEFSSYGF
jgi:hypothetical protein